MFILFIYFIVHKDVKQNQINTNDKYFKAFPKQCVRYSTLFYIRAA